MVLLYFFIDGDDDEAQFAQPTVDVVYVIVYYILMGIEKMFTTHLQNSTQYMSGEREVALYQQHCDLMHHTFS